MLSDHSYLYWSDRVIAIRNTQQKIRLYNRVVQALAPCIEAPSVQDHDKALATCGISTMCHWRGICVDRAVQLIACSLHVSNVLLSRATWHLAWLRVLN